MRADHLGAYGYAKAATPAIDRLAREGVRFMDATSQAPLTGPAHAALLTGVYPARIGVRDNATTPVPDSATTAAELFKSHGYRTGGFVGAFILTAPYGFAQGFDTFDADFPGFSDGLKLQVQRRGDAVVDAAVKWLDGGGTQPFFGLGSSVRRACALRIRRRRLPPVQGGPVRRRDRLCRRLHRAADRGPRAAAAASIAPSSRSSRITARASASTASRSTGCFSTTAC